MLRGWVGGEGWNGKIHFWSPQKMLLTIQILCSKSNENILYDPRKSLLTLWSIF